LTHPNDSQEQIVPDPTNFHIKLHMNKGGKQEERGRTVTDQDYSNTNSEVQVHASLELVTLHAQIKSLFQITIIYKLKNILPMWLPSILRSLY